MSVRSIETDSKIEAVYRLAAISFINGSVRKRERDAVLEWAQRTGVTTSEHLHTRLLLQASVPPKSEDNTADD